MRLRYTPEAADELERILNGISETSPSGGRRVLARIQAATDRLLDQPRSGPPTDLRPMRRTLARPYLIFYTLTEDEVVVVGIRHGARDPATMPDAPSDAP
ncbi:type II toxin-antitoxin system RelE/ParE family toxin [Methylobacterium terricola]|uniref:Type II toxin-antitoxin system RelE/ParE family toxin n=1 Tax=Methylobacterium terricola TaxID=2583531 RepID=A0A5C4LJH2_9HYPH|nr:type II toxin-antitoxin system RelE/ParE family toxin [Methylobacterium terricola]TNC12404.1 type II toxin-antitoxin system RelE/ParE family toxin [Methylobacterium terricola]